MTLSQIVFARMTTHAGVAALIGTRCYPRRLPENVVYPAVRYIGPVSNDDSNYRTHDNVNVPVKRSVARVQFDCYDTTSDGAELLANQVVAAWSGYQASDCSVGYAFKMNEIADRADALKADRQVVDIKIEYEI
jgi:hypothetical protein